MIYLDTSLLVAALGNEAATEAVQRWLGQQPAGSLAISEWTVTEFSSAMAMKLRPGQIQPEHRAECMAEFAHLREASLHVLAIAREHFHAAAEYTGRHETGLRAGDALHLAVCAHHGLRLATLDNTFHHAATTIGIACLEILPAQDTASRRDTCKP